MSTDYFKLYSNLNDLQKIILESTTKWVNKYVRPNIQNSFISGEPINLKSELAELGAFGSIFPEKYGGLNLDFISYGLMMKELEKGDSSVRVMSSIQTSLVMYSIYSFGSEEQKKKYLPDLASGKITGCFAMSEPSHGSDISNMLTKFKINGKNIIINGSKLWIGNAEESDISIVWARNDLNDIQGIIVETKNISNFKSTTIKNKWSFRSSHTGELFFDNSVIPKNYLLPGTKSIKDAYECLNIGRYAVSWGALGIAEECYETALKYSIERKQFGAPIASKQLIQKKLVEMITEISKAQLLTFKISELMENKKITYEQISMAKRNNVKIAQSIAHESRQILGGMGITNDYSIMRHIINLETLITYQGTNEMHILITGRDITGINAF
tara:strand:- start:28561 stop:29718 length:1158 start_codon:yes stop_codon:yes gene_type:complete